MSFKDRFNNGGHSKLYRQTIPQSGATTEETRSPLCFSLEQGIVSKLRLLDLKLLEGYRDTVNQTNILEQDYVDI